MDIDFNTRGTESSTAKIMRLNGAAKKLEGSWNRYSLATTKGTMAGGAAFAGVRGVAGGASGAGLLSGALGAYTISKLLSKSEAIRNSALLQGDREMWRAVAKETRVNWKLFVRKYDRQLSLSSGSISRILSGILGGSKFFDSFMGQAVKQVKNILTRVPVVTVAAVVAGAALMDERVSKSLSSAVSYIGQVVQTAIANTVGAIGSAWNSFKNGLALATGNAYYASSQFNAQDAVKNFTPSAQKKFLEDTERKQREEGMAVTIQKTKKELIELFRAENEKNNAQYKSIVEIMRYSGRL